MTTMKILMVPTAPDRPGGTGRDPASSGPAAKSPVARLASR
ncbi:hypothetical protein [Methylobacterium oryzihabitans]|nr:hypothetical protein [Methylobacterium oryzihabitans]